MSLPFGPVGAPALEPVVDRPRIGSLFTGTGALDMAARDVLGGGEVVWYSDIKPAAAALLVHRYPGVPNLGDLLRLFPVDTSPDLLDEHGAPLDDLDPRRWLPVTADVPPADVLVFGWPCQPHSSAGKRLGEADPRALLRNVLRAVGHLRPRILFGENVARVATNGELRRAVRALAAIGYVGAWRCVTASDAVGAPHKRDRVALVAVRADAAPDALGVALREVAEGAHGLDGERAPLGRRELLPARPDRGGAAPCGGAASEPADGRRAAPGDAADRAVPAALTLFPTPTQSMTTGAGTSGRDGGLNLQTAVTLLPTPSASNYGTNQGGAAGRVGLVRESLDTMARRGRFDGALLPTPRASDGPNGGPNQRGQRGDLAMPSAGVLMHGRRWGVYAAAVHRWEQALGRPAPDPTQPSEVWRKMLRKRLAGADRRPAGMRGSLAPRMQLAPAFVEWMMGLPAGWVTDVPGLTRSQQLSLLGDGVVHQQLANGYRRALADLVASLAAGRMAA